MEYENYHLQVRIVEAIRKAKRDGFEGTASALESLLAAVVEEGIQERRDVLRGEDFRHLGRAMPSRDSKHPS